MHIMPDGSWAEEYDWKDLWGSNKRHELCIALRTAQIDSES